jgi:hypothetical protein
MSHPKESITRFIAGWLLFLTLTQYGDRPAADLALHSWSICATGYVAVQLQSAPTEEKAHYNHAPFSLQSLPAGWFKARP